MELHHHRQVQGAQIVRVRDDKHVGAALAGVEGQVSLGEQVEGLGRREEEGFVLHGGGVLGCSSTTERDRAEGGGRGHDTQGCVRRISNRREGSHPREGRPRKRGEGIGKPTRNAEEEWPPFRGDARPQAPKARGLTHALLVLWELQLAALRRQAEHIALDVLLVHLCE